jgi:hypothetical protein
MGVRAACGPEKNTASASVLDPASLGGIPLLDADSKCEPMEIMQGLSALAGPRVQLDHAFGRNRDSSRRLRATRLPL